MAVPKGTNNVLQKPQHNKSITSSSGLPPASSAYKYENGERKIVDPVVARLKEARRLEKEKKDQEARAKKGLAAKPHRKPKSTIPLRTGPNKPVQAKKSSVSPVKKPVISSPMSSRPKPAKMKFNELMKKASGIDQSKLSITFKAKTQSPENDPRRKSRSPSNQGKGQSSKASSKVPSNGTLRGPSRGPSRIREGNGEDSTHIRPNETQNESRIPIPTRGPSSKLAEKLKKKPQPAPTNSSRYDEYESEEDLDGFIASDEEEEVNEDYNRDEIWAMFNRGKKRSQMQFDDYDSDDMEATGAEIFDEERKSKRRAELEDKKELEEEQRRAQLKKQRKMGKK